MSVLGVSLVRFRRMVKVTLANWRTPEASAWAFRHVRDLIPTVSVPASTPWRLEPFVDNSLFDQKVLRPGSAGNSIREELGTSHTNAVVVLHEGRLVGEWYADKVQPEDLHIVFSVSKSITALFAGVLASTGRLDVEAPIVRYIPELEGSGYGSATVRHLLDMTAAMDFVEDYSLQDELMLRYRQATNWVPGTKEEGLHEFLGTLTSSSNHGHVHHYMSPNTDMLGWVCERASEMPFAEGLSKFFWGPMGARNDAEVTVDHRGAARAAGGMTMTARDMARVGQLVLDGGRDVVPDWFVEDLFAGGDPQQWSKGDRADHIPGGTYRSCWYKLPMGPGIVAALGIHGQMIYVDRPRQVVVAKQSHWPEAVSKPSEHSAFSLANTLAVALQD